MTTETGVQEKSGLWSQLAHSQMLPDARTLYVATANTVNNNVDDGKKNPERYEVALQEIPPIAEFERYSSTSS